MIALGCDHAGYKLMQEVKKYLDEHNLEYKDYGTDSEQSCDFPVYGAAVGHAVANGECDRGIVICGSGIGISMAANKIPGARAGLCCNAYAAEMTRRHNDANILAMGERFVGVGLALKIVEVFLNTGFDGDLPGGERHARRIEEFSEIEKGNL